MQFIYLITIYHMVFYNFVVLSELHHKKIVRIIKEVYESASIGNKRKNSALIWSDNNWGKEIQNIALQRYTPQI